MRIFLLSSFLILFLLPVSTNAQRDSSRNDFLNAESWFLFEEYREAEDIYQKLLMRDPENDNLKYKIGICLLNDPYRKGESIAYLLDASNNINPDYKESSFKENSAPPDVLYYLGNAYLVNDMLDPAIETFERFLKILDPEVYDDMLVKAQIKACENAKRLKTMPVDFDITPLGPPINTRYADINPVISGDGKKMAFVTEQPFFDEALFVEKVDGHWSLPMSLTAMLGFDENVYPVGLSYDGTEMLLYYDDEHIGNLYYSRYEDGLWLPAVKLGENISTKYWESHGCFSKDGKSIYFTSNRKGTFGGLDIYRSDRLPDGGWGVPENLGPTVNSRYNEETPFITEDGQTLFFSSYGHFNIGGYDIFYSKRNKDGSWSEPVNLGYPINTTGDDLFFQPVKNGFGGYQSRLIETGEGRFDICYLELYSVDNPRMYLVTGSVRTPDGEADLTRLEMFVIDLGTGDTIKFSVPIEASGAFQLDLAQGNYTLHFQGEGYEELIRPLSITASSNKGGIRLRDDIELKPAVVVPLVFEGDQSLIQLRDTVYNAVAGESLSVPLRLEKGALLVTSIYHDSVLVSVDSMVVERRRMDLEIMALPGTSRVELMMIDIDGNIHKNGFTVTGRKPAPVKPAVEPEAEPEAEMEVQETTAPWMAGPVGLLLPELREKSGGELHRALMAMDPGKEELGTPQELCATLYGNADQGGYTREEVDLLLAGTISDGDVVLLCHLLLENSGDPLHVYLEGLDLEEEGIHSPDALIRHLEEAAAENGFTMDDVRAAMIRSLDHPLEVEQRYLGLLETAGGTVLEILKEMHLPGGGIYTVEELIRALYHALLERGYDKDQAETLLLEMFPDQPGFIKELIQKDEGKGFPFALAAGILAVLLLLILLWFRRKRKAES
jgi:tetratricopeptide (TPR) repeat protein